MVKTAPTVLYVEDNDDQREILTGLLGDNGLHVIQARDGEHALRLLAAGLVPDIVLTDMKLPRMSGPELMLAIWAIPSCAGIPIATLTGAELPLRGVPKSVVVFQKPCGMAELVGGIRKIAAHYEAVARP